jgi:hypothetical protein
VTGFLTTSTAQGASYQDTISNPEQLDKWQMRSSTATCNAIAITSNLPQTGSSQNTAVASELKLDLMHMSHERLPPRPPPILHDLQPILWQSHPHARSRIPPRLIRIHIQRNAHLILTQVGLLRVQLRLRRWREQLNNPDMVSGRQSGPESGHRRDQARLCIAILEAE